MKRWILIFSLVVFALGVTCAGVLAQEKVFTMEELALFDGKDGRQAYYGYEGKVYDVSTSTLWKLGQHFGYSAGKDLTGKLEEAPHGDDIVKAMPVVGTLATAGSASPSAPTQEAVPSDLKDASLTLRKNPWWEGRIRLAGLSLLGWTGILLAVVFILNFATCFALPWSKFPLPWEGARPGPDAMDVNHIHLKWAQVHKYFAWATVVLGIIHGVLGLLQVFGVYL